MSEVLFAPDEVDELSARFENSPAEEIVGWAVERFHPRLSIAASMTDAVLIDIAVRVEPRIDVIFIDTGYHFPETLSTVDAVRARYGIDLRVMAGASLELDPWVADPERCCSDMKVALLGEALRERDAWMSGLRRVDAATRADAPIVSVDRRELVKVNPLANWSDHDIATYVRRFDVPVNPLVAQGYPSIGCWPCTRAVAPGEHPRSGRWPGSGKTECGIHE